MAKSKSAPALFEVMNRQKNTGNLGVPKWWKSGSGNQPNPAEPEPAVGPAGEAAPDPAEIAPAEQSEQPESATAPPTAAVVGGAEPRKRRSTSQAVNESAESASGLDEDAAAPASGLFGAARLESGLLHLVLRPTQAAVIGGALVIALLVSFQLGRSLGGSSAAPGADTSMKLLSETPKPGVLDAPDGKPGSSLARAGIGAVADGSTDAHTRGGASAAEADELKVGLHYVLLDKYPRDAFKTADFVQKWLESAHKIPTVLRERKDSYWLIGKAGFDFSIPGEKEKCTQYEQHIMSLGKECRRELIRADLPVYGFASPMRFLLQE